METLRVSNLSGTLPGAFSAHPKRDPRSGELHLMAYWWGWGNQVQYLVVDTTGRVRRHVDIPLPGGPMIHDLAITERYALIFDLPCVFNREAAQQGATLPYFWNPDYEARIGLLPLEGEADAVSWVSIDPCYIFHPMNAYDDGDTVVLDAVRHPKMFDHDQRGPNEGDPLLMRWRLDAKTGRSQATVIDDRPQEFPRIRESLIGRPYRYGYCAGTPADFAQGTLIKVDHHRGIVEVRHDQPRFGYGEPVFIPRDGGTAEDDGWVMALRYDRDSDTSDLAIFAAEAISDDPVAVIHLPVRVPNGFHGNWIADLP